MIPFARLGGYLAILSLLLACASAARTSEDSSETDLPLFVADTEGNFLGDAEVYLLDRSGERKIGTTNGGGVVRIPHALFLKDQPGVLLICREWKFCGAIRLQDFLTEDNAEISKPNEHGHLYIELADFALR